jgi:hypothetical protein
MSFVLIAAVACLVVAAFHFLFTRLLSFQKTVVSAVDILEAPFSPERYFVMDRLLDSADESFLASHPGYTRRMTRRFRKARVSIFRNYMKLLSEDFNRISRAVKLQAINSDVDRSDLAAVVMKEQFRFTRNMVYVEFRLVIYASGWKGVDATGLIASLNAMRDNMRTLAAVVEPTLA